MPDGAYSEAVLNCSAEGDVLIFKPLRPVMSMFIVPQAYA